MKIRNTVKAAILAGAVVVLGGVREAKAIVYTPGDLLVGFRATGASSSQDYVVNLGSLTQFTTTTETFTLSITGIGEDLSTLFTPDWSTRSDLFWSVVGTTYVDQFTTPVLYASRQRSNVSVPATAWVGASNSTQRGTGNTINQYGDQTELATSTTVPFGTAGNVLSSNNSRGIIQTAGASNQSYNSYVIGVSDFGQWTTVEGNFGNGTAGSVLDLFQVNPSTTATRLGSFSLNEEGQLSFTGAAVPEPSTYMMLLGGIAVVVIAIRRQRHLASVQA